MENNEQKPQVAKTVQEQLIEKELITANAEIQEVLKKNNAALLPFISREYTRDQAMVRLVSTRQEETKEVVNPNKEQLNETTKTIKTKKGKS